MKSHRKTASGIYMLLFAGSIFFFMLYFFLKCRTPVVHDGDDWSYIAFLRSALPIEHAWNPGRILPETIMPLCAKIATVFVMPFCGDYLWSMTVVLCVVLSLIIAGYICLFCGLLKHMMKIATGNAILLSFLLFIMHFRTWMSPWETSLYLFHSSNFTCYFYYTIPILLNACFVLYFERTQMSELFLENENIAWKGIVVLGVYLAMFSNMYANCVLAVYAGIRILEDIYECFRRRISWKAFIRKNAFYMFILVLWCVCAYYEVHGRRAASFYQKDMAYIDRFKRAVWNVMALIRRMDVSSLRLYIAVMTSALCLLLFSRGKHEEDGVFFVRMRRYAICIVLVTVYLMMLSAIVSTSYVGRMDVVLGIMVYAFLMVFSSAAYVIRRCPKVGLILPFLIFVISIDMFLIGGYNFELTNMGVESEYALAVSRNTLNQILSEDEKGVTQMQLIVPKGDDVDNWPYPTYLGSNMLITLRQHGMIENLERIETVPDVNYDSTFKLKDN